MVRYGIHATYLLIPPLFRNLYLSGNPFLPVFNEYFKSYWFYPSAYVGWIKVYFTPDFLVKLTFDGLSPDFNTAYSRYGFGFFYFSFFVFVPIAAWRFFRTKRGDYGILLAAICVTIGLWYKLTRPEFRYSLAFLPALALLFAVSIEKIIDIPSKFRLPNLLIYLSLFSVLTLNFVVQFFGTVNINHVSLPYPWREAITGDYSRSSLSDSRYNFSPSVKQVFDYASKLYGKDSRGIILDTPAVYFAGFNVLDTDMQCCYRVLRSLQKATPNDAMKVLTQLWDVSFIISSKRNQLGGLKSSTFLRKEFETDSFDLYQIIREKKGEQSGV